LKQLVLPGDFLDVGRAYSTAIITGAKGTRNISNNNNNYQQDNSSLDSGNNSNSNANQENRGL